MNAAAPLSRSLAVTLSITALSVACAPPRAAPQQDQTTDDAPIEPIPVELSDPIPIQRPLGPARLLRRATLALTGAYPDPDLLEAAARGEVDVEERIETLLGSPEHVAWSAGWPFQWSQMEQRYRVYRAGFFADPIANAFIYDLQYWAFNSNDVGPWLDGNPFFLEFDDQGNPLDPIRYEFVTTAATHAVAEMILIWRWLIQSEGDIRLLLTSDMTFRSQVLENAYAIREQAPAEPEPRILSEVGTPYSDELTEQLGGAWYFVDNGARGQTGILSTMAFLNHRINGRTRTNGVIQTFLCREIPAVDSTGYMPEGCEYPDSPQCEFYSHPTPACRKCHITLDPMAKLWMRYHSNDWPSDRFYRFNGSLDDRYCGADYCRPYPEGQDIHRNPAFDLGDARGMNPRTGLAQRVVDDPSFAQCLATRTFEQLTGRKLQPTDYVLQAQLVAALTENWKLKDLLRAVMATAAFRYE